MEKCLLYTENGDTCLFDNYSVAEAKKILKEKGYKKAYSGRKFNKYGIRVIVGINEHNAVPITDRRKNGLYSAKEIKI